MARVNTYTQDSVVSGIDKVLGTDVHTGATKNFTFNSVSEWLNSAGAVKIIGQNNYVFQSIGEFPADRLAGNISFLNFGGDGTLFSDVTELIFSDASAGNTSAAPYITTLVGKQVILANLKDLSNFGVYTLQSFIELDTEPGFYQATLVFINGSGALEEAEAYGIAAEGLQAEGGAWGSIAGTITDQTDLVDYVDAEIAAIPTPETPTLESVTNEGNYSGTSIGIGSYSYPPFSPSTLLHIKKGDGGLINQHALLAIEDTSRAGISITTSNTGRGHIFFGNANNSDYAGITYNHLSQTLSWTANGVARWKIDGNGNVLISGNLGVNTTSPSYPVHITGDTYISTGVAVGTSLVYANGVNINNSGQYRIGNAEFISKSANDMSIYQGRMWVQQAGNVGIGTTSPSTKLHVDGNIRVGDANDVIFTNKLYGLSTGDLTIYTSGNTLLTQTGNVGIGTTSPIQPLHVATNNNNTTLALRVSNDHTGGRAGISFNLPNITNEYYSVGVDNDRYFKISNGNNLATNTRMVISPAGNIGIGVTNPQHPVTLAASSPSSGGYTVQSTAGYEQAYFSFRTLTFTTTNAATVAAQKLYFHISGSSSKTSGDGFTFKPNDTRQSLGSSSAEQGFIKLAPLIDQSGTANYVGLLMDVTETSVGSGTNSLMDLRVGGTSKFTVRNSGKVGIGTDNPVLGGSSGLNIYDANYPQLKLTSAVTGTGVTSGFLIGLTSNDGGEAQIVNYENAGIRFKTNYTDRFIISKEGNVGIGTTAPTEKLHIDGNVLIENNLHVKGDVTIGKISNDSALVDVGGNFNFDTVSEPGASDTVNFTATIQNVAGNIDNGSHTYTVIYKTADGGETGAYNLTYFKTITITDNTTAGQVLLTGIPVSTDERVVARDIYRTSANDSPYYGKKLATINDNTTTTYTDNLPDSSLDQNTLFYRKADTTAGVFYIDNEVIAQAPNYHKTSFGLGALRNNTIGQDNVAIGGYSLSAITNGKQNTAIGYSSGSNNVDGQNNTFLGYVAGYFNDSGDWNTYVGSFAGRNADLSTTNYNTGVGGGSLYKLTTNNSWNTALGFYSGNGAQGQWNLHLGYYAGYKSTPTSIGSFNINIGAYTGQYTTGTGNILIGRQIDAVDTSGSNQLNIGNLIYATDLGYSTTQSTGNVGIGTTSPAVSLDVDGQVHLGPQSTTGFPSIDIASNGRTTIRASAPALSVRDNNNNGGYIDMGGGTLANINSITSASTLSFSSTNVRFGGDTTARVNVIGQASSSQYVLGLRQGSGGSNILLSAQDSTGAQVIGITANGGFYARDSNLIKRYVFDHDFSPSPADGMSVGFDFRTENKNGVVTTYGYIDVTNDDRTLQESSMRFSVGETTPTEIMRLQSNGNVGIGTTAPAAKLDVVGTIKLDDGGGSVYVGNAAGYNDTATFNYNVGIGDNALAANTSGSNNIAVGPYALYNPTNTSGNVAVGNSALGDTTTGYRNVAIGNLAHSLNTSGYENVAIGHNALGTATSPYFNVAVGSYALGNADGVASDNTAVGYYAMALLTTGRYNTSLGTYALSDTELGSNNTAVGYYAGGGDYQGTNSVYLGMNTSPNSWNETNQIVIGYGATGNGSNSVTIGNTSITKTIMQEGVGVGVTSPTSSMHIDGAAMRQLRINTPGGPTSSADTTGNIGDIAYDDLYFYIKTTNGWGRVPLDFGF